MKRAKTVYGFLLAISLAWLGSVFAAPWLMARHHPLSSLTLYQAFSVICHQAPERSFHFCGFPLGVCSRCTGIYAGFVIGLMLYPFLRDLSNEIFPHRRWLVAPATIMLIDFTGGYIGLFSSTFLSRTVTGLLFGAVAAFFILPGLVATLADGAGEAQMERP